MPNPNLITALKFKIQEFNNTEIGEGKCNTSQKATMAMSFYEFLRKVNKSNIIFKVGIEDHFKKRNRI